MIVVGIMGVVMAMGVPIVYKVFHRPPMAQALVDVVEVCSNARSRAILQGHEVDLVFHPRAGTIEVGAAASTPSSSPSPAPGGPIEALPVTTAPKGSGLSAVLNLEKLRIEMLDVNLTEYKDEEIARVRFYPNGTCDEMTLILHSDDGQWKKISLEITTGLASVEEVR